MTVYECLKACSDDRLVDVMLGGDRELADLARREFEARHISDPTPTEPAHCAECFEGCAKCQPKAGARE